MRSKFALVLPLFLSAALAIGQQTAAPPATNPIVAASTVYYAGPGISAPELLPASSPIKSIGNCEPLDGEVILSGAIDAEGFPRGMKTPRLNETDLDNLAIYIVSAERFKPGAHNGVPAAIAVLLRIGMQTCLTHVPRELGLESIHLTLRAQPIQELTVRSEPTTAGSLQDEEEGLGVYMVGGNIRPPAVRKSVEAEYPDHERERRIRGRCLIGLVVDSDGKPQNVHVVRGLDPILDRNAIEAVKKDRFKPAMRDGKIPVPVSIKIEVNFGLY
jgi:TonB family protein